MVLELAPVEEVEHHLPHQAPLQGHVLVHGGEPEELGGRVFVFVAPDPMASLYVPLIRVWAHKPAAKSFITGPITSRKSRAQ